MMNPLIKIVIECSIVTLFVSTGALAGPKETELTFNRRWAESAFAIGSVRSGANLPFSFVYDGHHSSELINNWRCSSRDEKIDGTRRCRTITLQDPKTGLEVRAVATIYMDTAGTDWTLYFTNNGDKDTPVLEQVRAVDATISSKSETAPVLHRLKGSTAVAAFTMEDFMPFDEPLPEGKRIEFGASGASSSYDVLPFFTIQWGDGGVVTAIGWSGRWGASIEHTPDGKLHLDGGMSTMRLKLHPGETIRSPRILQLYWRGKDESHGYNLFRQTMLSHIMPRIDGKLVTPPITHTSSGIYETNGSTEPMIMSYLDSVKGLGFEYFWLDAYWMRGNPNSFPNGMGQYGFPISRVPNPVAFPNGLKPIGDAVHRDGMKFLAWFGVETVMPGTFLATQHPDWIMSTDGSGGGTLNLGNPTARNYITRYLNAAIKQYGINCFRTDSGPNLAGWAANDQKEPNRVGMTEIRYVEGLYRMWDDIRKANPCLFIDNCCGGGTRIDLETCARSIPLWRTDTLVYLLCVWGSPVPIRALEAAIENQKTTAALSRYVPFSTGGTVGTTPYLFRSGFNAGITFCEDTRTPGYPRDVLKQAIAEGKRIRKYYLGNLYPLSQITTSPSDWCVTQYHRTNESDGMVMAFRRNESRRGDFICKLREIDPEAKYRVTVSHTYDRSRPVVMNGSELRKIEVRIDTQPGAVLIEYKKVDRPR